MHKKYLTPFNDVRFTSLVNNSLHVVKRILDTSRSPQLASEVTHEYDDKYLLADFLSNCSIASHLSALEVLGLNETQLKQFQKWGESRTVTIRFKSEETCVHVKDKKREVESPSYKVEVSGPIGKASVKQKTVTTVVDSYWKFTYSFSIVAFSGNDPDNNVVLKTRSGSTELITTDNKSSPYPTHNSNLPIDVNISWLLKQLTDSSSIDFSINRNHKKCHTPRRNPEVDSALTYFALFFNWSDQVISYFERIFAIQLNHGQDVQGMNADDIFIPGLPLFEIPSPEKKKETAPKPGLLVSLMPVAATGETPVLSIDDSHLFLAEHLRSIKAKLSNIEKSFKNDELVTVVEATVVFGLNLAQRVSQTYSDGVDYIEHMLRQQLISAIGKELTPKDFGEYMKFHNRKLFKPIYTPKPFCYAVRVPDHYPEGLIEIGFRASSNSTTEPINTVVRRTVATTPMTFPINSATNISFYGDRYVHAFVSHRFTDSSQSQEISLISRARQFSSFIVLIGGIPAANVFDPKHAFILQNKDEFKIPLLFETIPPPKQFKDTIASLSPEQQRFAKAIRSLQLSETIFGIVVLQIKPQLEKVLNLPHDSLTKEIKMTQDLMQFFIEYQIPTDLISYSILADPNAPIKDKVDVVRHHMKAMKEMITGVNETAQKELNDKVLMNVGVVDFPTKCYQCGTGNHPLYYYNNPENRITDEYFKSGLSALCSNCQHYASSRGWTYHSSSSGAVKVTEMFNKKPIISFFGAKKKQQKETDYRYKKKESSFNSSPVRSKALNNNSWNSDTVKNSKMEQSCSLPKAKPAMILPPQPQQQQQQQRQQQQQQQQLPPQPQQPQKLKQVTTTTTTTTTKSEPQKPQEIPKSEPQKPQEIPKSETQEPQQDQQQLQIKQDSQLDISYEAEDYSKIPEILDRKYEELDTDGTLRPTIIKTDDQKWEKTSQFSLLSDPVTTSFTVEDQIKEKRRTFDLLDSLSRSGCLSFDHASLHVIVASTHCFDKTLMNTVIQDNYNPIEKVERSTLILASTIQNQTPEELVNANELKRVSQFSPNLFIKKDELEVNQEKLVITQ